MRSTCGGGGSSAWNTTTKELVMTSDEQTSSNDVTIDSVLENTTRNLQVMKRKSSKSWFERDFRE